MKIFKDNKIALYLIVVSVICFSILHNINNKYSKLELENTSLTTEKATKIKEINEHDFVKMYDNTLKSASNIQELIKYKDYKLSISFLLDNLEAMLPVWITITDDNFIINEKLQFTINISSPDQYLILETAKTLKDLWKRKFNIYNQDTNSYVEKELTLLENVNYDSINLDYEKLNPYNNELSYEVYSSTFSFDVNTDYLYYKWLEARKLKEKFYSTPKEDLTEGVNYWNSWVEDLIDETLNSN